MAVSAAKVKKLVAKGFGKLGTLRTTLTYNRLTSGAYDPAAGAVALSTVSTTITNAIVVGTTAAEQEWFPAERRTQKVLIPSLNLPIPPTTSDTITIDSVAWEIIKTKEVPGDSLWIIFIMEP